MPLLRSAHPGPFFGLLAYEAVFRGNDVVREFGPIKDMPELVGEFRVLVVGGFEKAVLDAERVSVVLAQTESR